MKSARYIICLFLLASKVSYAQLSPMLYNMTELSLRHQLNPAFQPKHGSIYIGIPFLSSLQIKGESVGKNITYNNLLGDNPNYQKIINSKDPLGQVQVASELNIFNLGLVIKGIYFTFDNKLKIDGSGRATKDLQRLIWLGNGHEDLIDTKLDLQNTGVDMLVYTEHALGASVPIIKGQLTVGAKIKYLYGLSYNTLAIDAGSYIHTDPNNYNITVGFNPDIYTAGARSNLTGQYPLDSLTEIFSLKDALNGNGSGVGFDFGAEWQVPMVKGLTVSASVLNLGSMIKWRGTSMKVVDPNQTFEFEGLDLDAGSDFSNSLTDSIKRLTIMEVTSSRKKTRIRPTVYLGASYDLHKYLNVAALYGYQGGLYTNSSMFSISANAQNFMVNPSIAYSYIGGKNNLGIGTIIGRKYVQFHIILDNIMALNFKSTQYLNARLGLNLLFGKSQQEKLAKGIIEQNEILAPEERPAIIDTTTTSSQNLISITNLENIQEPEKRLSSIEEEWDDDKPVLTRFSPSEKSNKTQQQNNNLSNKELLLKKAMEEEAEDKKRNMH
ncbi:MAG: DUF5723 family protein [Bacteroidales bacterium]